MARAGLGVSWRCLFANDFNEMKVATYEKNWGRGDMKGGDVAQLTVVDLPNETVDLAWASFPCQDLSLAGEYRGLGREFDNVSTRSGTFWPFWKLMRGLAHGGRAPRTIVLENVYGCLTSRGGKDFAAISSALASSHYRFGAAVVDASHFVPQSRPRVFFVAARSGESIPKSIIADGPQPDWHPKSLIKAYEALDIETKKNWMWWAIPRPRKRTSAFADIIEERPSGVTWHTPEHTEYILSLMTPLHLQKVATAKESGMKVVGSVYRRTRPDETGLKRQRAEVRFDDIAGCLRTPAGGSSRQTILVVEGNNVRSRLLSPREAARLMGLRDNYRLPAGYNDAYHVCGDGVCVPVVRHLARHILEPVLRGRSRKTLLAAE
ncbi:DNA (cytosine-5)-methyltransferase 1 [Roseiarcus fermentans]|uniref:DNA (cytosine-5-)-methyltransferase n=2 Tax=Roseiarcus fermentans TaxID=1473586 RepID=A0A366ENS2_9HYPH|nr:DNA (cytosine-5)-methyltransferase 1 [Roseiarcus fermentans]